MAIAVSYQYGKNSNEYKMASGTRKGDRKRPARKAEPSARPSLQSQFLQ